jgi:hypothetical protein
MPGMLLSPEHGVLPLDQSLCTCKKATFDSWGALLLRETSHDLFLLAAGAEVFYHQGKVSVEWKLVTYRSEGLSYQCRRRNVTAGSGKLSADSESNRTGVDDSKACCVGVRDLRGEWFTPHQPLPLQHTQLTLFRLQRPSENEQHKNETSCSFNACTHNNNSVITVSEHYTQTGA